ncbi:similar to Saccharomyces cerevisiae YBL051C PIN4 Protein involved in G2/M phase progression and response to DNA damage, interacts with Rad53p [Maudiozyma saulgeensis]|uniref:Similar to Saccharomyces cerevisiae YBL051C PIN4 Protein involved in G2/M phase progression and response to DNA damage, interacts with Rad53p n=1 Tax=Maudiozyma saulgeensis TaxID=1789683 RepID=A0A1X7R4V9_9SACH|nr:similar to Saccharomyces cerevisiae YBL051C PIN4 Protein involved in G2/M phase progression and response to DNA damage, interacts with Rad53p [Kazachstania saulgeensis]
MSTNEGSEYMNSNDLETPVIDKNGIDVSNENDADEFDQAQLEKLSEKETDDDNENDNNNTLDNSITSMSENDRLNDDIIPNAIVIKNIPFAIKKEQLLDIIDEMNLPLPYAFNYHFDNGIFRGLAFANFTTAEETLDVITNLNGKEINGRKLKVEYKKMLPQAERERIEREKREKRGQLEEQHRTISNLSLQSLGKMSSVSLNQNNSNIPNGNFANNSNNAATVSHQIFSSLMNGNKTGNSNNNMNNNNSGSNGLAQQSTSNSYYSQKSQYQYQSRSQQQPKSTSQQQQIPPFGYVQNNGSSQNITAGNNNNSNGQSNGNSNGERYYAPLPSSSTIPIPPQQLDFNDPDTLEIYSQLLLFRDREKYYSELAYPIGLSANYKRVINVLCSYLNLIEVYDPRFVIIRRKFLDQASLQTHLQQQGQMPIMHPLQPNSTGGSLNRSHSYTSLLQAHASAAAAAASNTNDNNSTVSHNSSTLNSNGTASLLAQTAAAQQAQTLSRGFQNQSQSISSPTPAYPSSFYSNDQAQGSNPSLQSPLLSTSNSQSQQPQSQSANSSQSAQQQAFLRQPNPLTPSARIPSGYSSNTQLLNSSNPLLRNSNMVNNNQSPQTATTQRILSSLHNNSSSPSQLHDQIVPTQSDNPLLQQNTSGSVQSNFSAHSFHDDSANMLLNANNNSNVDIIYGGTSGIGLDSGLEHHLSRSLSGLDVSGTMNNNNNSNSNTPNMKRSMW